MERVFEPGQGSNGSDPPGSDAVAFCPTDHHGAERRRPSTSSGPSQKGLGAILLEPWLWLVP